MRKSFWVLPTIMCFFATLFFAGNLFSTSIEDTSIEREWKLEEMCDVKIMDVDAESFSFTDLQKSLIMNKIENGSLTVSMDIRMSSTSEIGEIDGAEIRIVTGGVVAETKIDNVSLSDSIMNGVVRYNLSNMYNKKNKETLCQLAEKIAGGRNSIDKIYIKANFRNPVNEKNGWKEVSLR